MAPTVLTSTVPGSGENAQQGTIATGHPKETETMAPRMSGAKQRQMRASGRLAGPWVLEERPRAAGTDQRRRPTARGRGRRRLGLRLLGCSSVGGADARKRSLAWLPLEVSFLEELGGSCRRPAQRRKGRPA